VIGACAALRTEVPSSPFEHKLASKGSTRHHPASRFTQVTVGDSEAGPGMGA
jgi:hypothetical protein